MSKVLVIDDDRSICHLVSQALRQIDLEVIAAGSAAEGIERLWEISQPLLDNPPPVRPYPPGSWGPEGTAELVAPHRWRLPFERRWRELRISSV